MLKEGLALMVVEVQEEVKHTERESTGGPCTRMKWSVRSTVGADGMHLTG